VVRRVVICRAHKRESSEEVRHVFRRALVQDTTCGREGDIMANQCDAPS
jgi:hypothetical protein